MKSSDLFSCRLLAARFTPLCGLTALASVTALSLLGAPAANAQATTLSNTTSVTPVLTAGTLGGTLLQTLTTTFYAQQAAAGGGFDVINGTLVASVYSAGTIQTLTGPGGSHTFGGTNGQGQGLLDFYYQIRLDSPNVGPNPNTNPLANYQSNNSPVSQITLSSFANFNTAVGQNSAGPNPSFAAGGIVSSSAIRSSLGTIAFSFDTPQIATAGFSDVLVVRTSATAYQTLGVASPSGTVSANTSTLAPLAALAPEPGAFALLATGFLPIAALLTARPRRSRRSKSAV